MTWNNTLLLTSAISVDEKMFGHKTIPQGIRVQQYVDTLIFYITKSFFTHIVFCDGTNYDMVNINFLQNLAKIYNKKIEFLSFQQDISLVLSKGKWYGENKIIEYAVQNSQFIVDSHSRYKITGRYIILNINKIIAYEEDIHNAFFRTSLLDRQNCNTAFFKTTTPFFVDHLQWAGEEVNDMRWKYNYLEHIYYRRLSWKGIACFHELPQFDWVAWWWWSLKLSLLLTITKEMLNKVWLHRL